MNETLVALPAVPEPNTALGAAVRLLGHASVLVVGDVMLDHYIWGDATRISPEAPVPVIDIARDSWTAGGAANVAVNIAGLGARCSVFGFIGADADGERLRSILREKGVSAIASPGDGTTIVKTICQVSLAMCSESMCRNASRPNRNPVTAKTTAKIARSSAVDRPRIRRPPRSAWR